jgi:hypothetical protein
MAAPVSIIMSAIEKRPKSGLPVQLKEMRETEASVHRFNLHAAHERTCRVDSQHPRQEKGSQLVGS